MERTNIPSQPPVVETLSEEQVAKIEARALQVKELVGVGQFGEDTLALCQSLRAARKQLDDALVRAAEDQDYDSEQRAMLAKGNTALREQLAQVKKERDELKAARLRDITEGL